MGEIASEIIYISCYYAIIWIISEPAVRDIFTRLSAFNPLKYSVHSAPVFQKHYDTIFNLN